MVLTSFFKVWTKIENCDIPSKNLTQTIESNTMISWIFTSDFVASTSYNRKDLWRESREKELKVDGETYSITYYGLLKDSSKHYLVTWVGEYDCDLEVAGTPGEILIIT